MVSKHTLTTCVCVWRYSHFAWVGHVTKSSHVAYGVSHGTLFLDGGAGGDCSLNHLCLSLLCNRAMASNTHLCSYGPKDK